MTHLQQLIEAYAENKALADDYKKIADKENKEIKELMKAEGLENESSDNYTAKYYVTTRESMNEEKLLEILKREDIIKCIKTIEVVDMDILESMLYNDEISNNVVAEMNSCREIKKVVNLKVTKKKEN